MWSIIERAKKVIFALLLSIVPLILLYVQNKDQEIRSAIAWPLVETAGLVEKAAVGICGKVSDYLFRYFYHVSRSDELRDLRARVQETEILRAKVLELINEKASIDELYLSADHYAGASAKQHAKVVARVGAPLSRMIRVAKGSLHGISAKDPVIAYDGVVGQVLSVAPHFSDVLLITDASFAFEGRIASSSARGLVRGISSSSKYLMELNDIDGLISVNDGDMVVTSGINSAFPSGIPVGRLSRIQKSKDGLWSKARIEPFVDFKRLDHVVILKLHSKNTNSPEISVAPWPLAAK